MIDPAAHEAHELPLANRIVSDLIGEWVDIAARTALAGFGDANDYERGAREGIRQMRYLHLSGWNHALTPQILDALRRAGLLTEDVT